MRPSFSLICCFFLLFSFSVSAQDTVRYTLEEVITMAKEGSLAAKRSQNQKLNGYWNYRFYQSNYKPQLRLNGTLPNFNRSILRITLPDGSDAFVNRTLANYDLGFSLDQSIAATGGTISLNSSVQRIDLLGDNKMTSYATTPLSLSFNQPLFAFNRFKWDKKIEPLLYKESLKRYNENQEEIALEAGDRFFNLLLAQITLNISQLNKANNDTIFRIAQGRYRLGTVAENELLQLELSAINAAQQVTRARLDLEKATLALNLYIGNPDNKSVKLLVPRQIPTFDVNPTIAVEQAKANRQQYESFNRRRMEAAREVAQARGETGLNVNLFGNFGLVQSAATLSDAYKKPQDQQQVNIGFQVPVVDWGRRQARIKTAAANQEAENAAILQDQLNFEQEIYILAKQFDLLRQQLVASTRADEVAQKRYDISQKRYLVAKISITDLNIALQDKDAAKRDYLQAMRDFWRGYYQLRMLTLYDFEKNEPIAY